MRTPERPDLRESAKDVARAVPAMMARFRQSMRVTADITDPLDFDEVIDFCYAVIRMNDAIGWTDEEAEENGAMLAAFTNQEAER